MLTLLAIPSYDGIVASTTPWLAGFFFDTITWALAFVGILLAGFFVLKLSGKVRGAVKTALGGRRGGGRRRRRR